MTVEYCKLDVRHKGPCAMPRGHKGRCRLMGETPCPVVHPQTGKHCIYNAGHPGGCVTSTNVLRCRECDGPIPPPDYRTTCGAKECAGHEWKGTPIALIVSDGRGHLANLRKRKALTYGENAVLSDAVDALADLLAETEALRIVAKNTRAWLAEYTTERLDNVRAAFADLDRVTSRRSPQAIPESSGKGE